MAELVLMRHGETEWSLTGQHTGVTDIPLTEQGEQQARRLATALHGRHFGTVLCSPRQRARDTAALAGLTHITIDDNLAEWDYGAYEGRTTAEISAELGYTWSVWRDGVLPGATPGESAAQVQARADKILTRARPIIDAGTDVLLVAHGHILRILTAAWLALPPEAGALFALSTGSISSLGFERDQPALTGWNQVPGCEL